MRNDLVSIIMPAFNAEKYILESINSAIVQSYTDWELIVIDDKSSDGTVELVKNSYINEPRVRVLKSSVNGGPGIARNLGIANANGRWLAFLDSDDMWDKNKLELQLDFQKKNDAALTYTAFKRFKQFDKPGSLVNVPISLNYFQSLGNTAIPTSTVIIDREKVVNFKMTETVCDDFVSWVKIIKQFPPALGINKDLMRYRVLPNSVSRRKLRNAYIVWKTYRQDFGFNVFKSLFFFIQYATNALIKYSKFWELISFK